MKTPKVHINSISKYHSSNKDAFTIKSFVSRFNELKTKMVSDSILLMKHTLLQIDFIAANRAKQMNSLSGLYGRLYGSEALFSIISLLSKRLRGRYKHVLLGASLFQTSFDWDEARVKESELLQYSQEIETCKQLTEKTLMCQTCQKRLRIEKEVEEVQYCQCKNTPKSVYGLHGDKADGWTPFLERKDILVWRKEHPSMKGMYFYKMYGKFDDVTADEFIQVQTDTSDFRLEWDNSTKKCSVVDEKKEENFEHEVYYWETLWPRFFANRFYCCSRQLVKNVNGTTILLSKSAQHPQCSSNKNSGVVEVSDYESVLTVKPTSSSDQLGLEFSLVGFENPGVKLPEAIITWVAIRGMPEFMLNLRKACFKYRDERKPETYPPHAINTTDQRYDSKDESYNMNSSRIYA